LARFVQQDGKRRGGYTWWVLVAGEGAREGAAEDGTARPVIATERLREETEREKNGRLPDEEAGWKPSRSGEKGLIRFGRFGFFDNLCANTAVFCVYRVLF
jgi:hypothetical protein